MPEARINGVRLVYEEQGSGDPVLLVCGTGQPAFSWGWHQVPALTAAGYRVVTFDNRGMAPSDAPPGPYTVSEMARDTAELIETLGLAPCRVAGFSLGAFVTQELALAHPDLLRAVALIGTFARKDAFRRALMKSWVELDESGIELPRLYDAVSSSFFLFSPTALDDDAAMDLYLETAVTAPAWTGAGKRGQHEADLSYDGRTEALAQVRVPAMVVAFELDMVTPTHLGREVAKTIPGCRYVEILRCGHAGIFEKPNEVNAALLEFFAET